MKLQIKSWFNGGILFEGEFGSMKLCVEAAIEARADLTGAVLTRADLTRAVLTRAVLTPIRDDFWAVLSSAPAEVPALIDALKAGKVNGSTYTGECACLVGTLANARKCDYQSIPGLVPNGNRPAERFFVAIQPGGTPDKIPFAKLAIEWATDWLNRMQTAFGKAEEVKA